MTKNGKPVASGWKCKDQKIKGLKILKRAAQLLEPGIRRQTDANGHLNVYKFITGYIMLPDTFTLLETVTSPSLDLDKLRDQLWMMKNALIKAAAEFDCTISGSACPVGYDNQSFPAAANSDTRCNNAGMHIHLNAPSDRVKIKLANLLVQIIPELTALSTNSPIYNQAVSKYYSDRLHSSPLVGADNVEVLIYDPGLPLQFDDPRKRYRFVTVWTKSKRTIEIRGFDSPMTIDWAMAIAAIIQCLAVKATNLFLDETFRRSTVMSDKKAVRLANYEAAIQKGLGALFIPDNTTHVHLKSKGKKQSLSFLYHNEAVNPDKKIRANLAVKRLLYYIEAEAFDLGLTKYLEPIYQAVATQKNQSDLQISWYREEGYKGFLNKLTAESGRQPDNGLIESRLKRNYFTVRQKRKGSSGQQLSFTLAALGKLCLKSGDRVTVSGPLASLDLAVANESRNSNALPLSEDEVRLGLGIRDTLGVSLYDPVIIGQRAMVPIVIQKTNDEWKHIPQTIRKKQDLRFSVQKGLKDYPHSIVISERDANTLNIHDGDKVKVAGSGGQTADFPVTVLRGLRSGIVAMMLKGRKSIGLNLGDSVKLIPRRASTPVQRKLTVVPGHRNDIGASPPAIRLSRIILTELGLTDGTQANVEINGQAGKELKTVVVKCDTRNRSASSAGLVKSVRDDFKVNLGDHVTLSVNRS
jgi:hypothetical protein